jgi:hypothetical protein
MVPRIPAVLLLVLSTVLPLGGAGSARAAEEAETGASDPDPFPGTYRVKGLTTDVRSGDTRRIEGIVVLRTTGEGVYGASSELETKFPSEGGPMDTHVIGNGRGRRNGDVIEGTAETQLVMGTVPGIEAEFAFAPRVVGPRLESTWNARFRSDGTLLVEIENRGAAGETYSPTRTTLYGTRLAERAPAE